ncbi:MAG: sulfite exporter TauE/SafE family protein [Bacteroidota bacterium]
MDLNWYLILAVIGVGFVAGFINTIAGSGSLLTLPLLMFLGLDANMANGTNRIGILLQNATSVASFKQQKVFEWKHGSRLAIPAVIGSLIGAWVAIDIDEKIMKMAIAGILIVMFFLIIFKPDKWIKGQAGKINEKPSLVQYIIFFFIGMYGGFIQAGVGFFLLAGLVLGAGLDLVKANAIKVWIIMLFTIFALAIFIYHGQVDYKIGLILAIGNMIGGFVGSRVAVSWGPKFVRIVLLVAILMSALHLTGVFGYFYKLFGFS